MQVCGRPNMSHERECSRTLTRRRLHCPQPFRDFFEPSCVIFGPDRCVTADPFSMARYDRQLLMSGYFLTCHRECCLAVAHYGQADRPLAVFFNIPREGNDALCRRCFVPSVHKKLGLLPNCSFFRGGCEETRLRLGGAMQCKVTQQHQRGVYILNG
jgi:hypothetical protein